ncbi:TetR/AcrR family transcriptional regulator [Gordonia sp. DT30]|uniref:TetR/AcrR family transcriptional regulator n=1 Tax=Gordonia sp. DT30 TaxID=3416546 RepID=UPI003CEC2C1B
MPFPDEEPELAIPKSETTTRVTRGGHVPTGVSADRRVKAAERITKKSEITRQALVDGARQVFERDGYMDARVTDIVAQAGVSHGSFYTYFPSKREVFQEVIRQVDLLIREAVAHAPEDVPGQTTANLENANRRYLRTHHQNARILALMEQVATADPEVEKSRLSGRAMHVKRIERTILALQKRGLAYTDIDPRTTAGALVAMLASYAHWSTLDDPYDEDLTAKTLTQIWVRAIGLHEK